MKPISRRYEFQSHFIRGGNIILPEVIIIENEVITWSKRKVYLIGMDIKSMAISDVSQIDISIGVIGTDFTIYGRGENMIKARNFSRNDALRIKKIIGK